MADIVSPQVRSRMMARIGSHNTKPELAVRRFLHAAGIRYRLGGGGLPGRPDLVLRGARTAVFVHGCFWHRHQGCSNSTMPKTRTEFWSQKFARNVERDAQVEDELRGLGWHIEVLWECQTADEPNLLALARTLKARRAALATPSRGASR